MPLRKINRYIALNLIKNFKINNNVVFKTLYELCEKRKNLTIEDLGFLIGPIINSGGRLSSSQIAADLLISENLHLVKKKSLELIKLNKIRKEIENKILNEINFKKIEKENKDVIIYYSSKIKEGLIGIIASRLKDYFNKPSIVITSSQKNLKGSARSTINYNIGIVIKKLIDKKLIESGGGHNMAAGFSMKKNKLKDFEDFILEDFAIKNRKLNLDYAYDAEVSATAINKDFTDEINRIEPFGYGNPVPTFLIKNLKVVKAKIINNKHINVMLKPKVGKFIKSICFNSYNTQLGKHLLSYKNNVHVVAQIHENYWNNNKNLQLNIKDLFIELN
jgi:single-stranded-DNA-specific exonuclease